MMCGYTTIKYPTYRYAVRTCSLGTGTLYVPVTVDLTVFNHFLNGAGNCEGSEEIINQNGTGTSYDIA